MIQYAGGSAYLAIFQRRWYSRMKKLPINISYHVHIGNHNGIIVEFKIMRKNKYEE